jgi:hypothetical protein
MSVKKITTQYTRDRQTWGSIESYPVHRGAQLHIENDHTLSKDLLTTRAGDAWQVYIRHAPPFPIFGQYVLTNEVRGRHGIQHGPHGE